MMLSSILTACVSKKDDIDSDLLDGILTEVEQEDTSEEIQYEIPVSEGPTFLPSEIENITGEANE